MEKKDVIILNQEVTLLRLVCQKLEERGQKDMAATLRETRRRLAEILWYELLRKDDDGNYINGDVLKPDDSSEIPTL